MLPGHPPAMSLIRNIAATGWSAWEMWSRGRQSLFALVLACGLALGSDWHHAHRPVHYPPEWPLEYVLAPPHATAGEIRGFDGLPDVIEAQYSPWRELERDGQVSNTCRSWRIGFNTPRTFSEVSAGLEAQLAGRGWRVWRPMAELHHYYSSDGHYRIILIGREKPTLLLSTKSCVGPGYFRGYAWQLSIDEYSQPVDVERQGKVVALDPSGEVPQVMQP